MMIHELVHASQVERLKQEKGFWWASDYWSANVYQQARNGGGNFPYGEKGGSRWQQIALSEGWGYFMEWTMARDILGWNALKDKPWKDESTAPNQKDNFPNNYATMFYELNTIGCSYQNLEKCLKAYSLREFYQNLINIYPTKSTEINNILSKYE